MKGGQRSRSVPASAMAPFGAAMLSFVFFLAVTAYPWQLAVLAATAIGAFVYSIQSTLNRMRRIARPLDSNDLAIGRDFSPKAGEQASVGRIED